MTLLFATGGLDAAKDAFARGDYAKAEQLAEAAARAQPSGSALYLVGLSRFREGNPEKALEALDAAERAPDAPPHAAWSFNRGASLYELGRFQDAEQAFVAAAKDPQLAALAYVNAGFAALDGGAPDRAQTLAQKAREVTNPDVAGELASLEEKIALARGEQWADTYARSLTAYDRGDYEKARDGFESVASGAAPELSAKAWVMAGASDLALGEREQARGELSRALGMDLSPADAHSAREYLARASDGLARHTPGWRAAVRVGTGFDSNVLQSGVEGGERELGPSEANASVASGFLTAGGEAAYLTELRDGLFGQLSYDLDQLTYLDRLAGDYSLQQHTLTLSLEQRVGPTLRLGAALQGSLLFTGIERFRGLEAIGRAEGWVALDEGRRTGTRLELLVDGKRALTSEFSYLTGRRFGVILTQTLRWTNWTADLSYGFRHEGIGTLSQSSLQPVPFPVCEGPCTSASDVIPFGYRSHALVGELHGFVAPKWEVLVSTGLEARSFFAPSVLRVLTPTGDTLDLDRRTRQDQLWLGSVAVGWQPWRALSLTLRYDVQVNGSNVARSDQPLYDCVGPDYACHALDYDNKNFSRHALSLDVGWSF